MKIAKKLISVLLAVVMTVSVLSIAAAAAWNKKLTYVAIGDSTSMGYYMDDFVDAYDRNKDGSNPENSSSEYSLFSLFGDFLEKSGVVSEKFDLSLTGMRPTELRAILDEDFYARYSETDNYVQDHLGYYTREINSDGVDDVFHSYDALQSLFIEWIMKANIITYDLSMAAINGYLPTRILDVVGGNYDYYENDTLEKLLGDESNKQASEIISYVRAGLEGLMNIAELPADMVSQLIEALAYTTAEFAVDFTASLNEIYKLNPAVQIIVVSPFSPIEGLYVDLDGVKIDLGGILNVCKEAITLYVTNAEYSNRYMYADITETVNTCADVMAADDYTNYQKLKELIVKEFNIAPENEEIAFANIAKAASIETVAVSDLSAALGGDGNKDNALYNYEEASTADRVALMFSVRFSAAHALGGHPNIDGYKAKADEVIATYMRGEKANRNYVTRGIKLAIKAVFETIKSILSGKTIRDTIASVIAAIVKLPIKL